MGVKKAHFQNGLVSKWPSSKTAYINNGSLLCSYLKIIRFFYRHFDYKISFFFHSDVTNNTYFGDMTCIHLLHKKSYIVDKLEHILW